MNEKIEMLFDEAANYAQTPNQEVWDTAREWAHTYVNEKCLISVGCTIIKDDIREYVGIAIIGPDKETVYKIMFIYEDPTKALVTVYRIPDKWKSDNEVVNFCRNGKEDLKKYELSEEKRCDIYDLAKKIIVHDS